MPQTVLITGASSGIGRATAALFAQRGAHLVLLARGRPALEEAAAEARAKGAADVVVCPADVLDEDALRTAVDGAVRRFGSLDVVVHSAQVIAYGRIEDVPKQVFERVVDTALHGTANLVRTVLPVFRRQEAGHLVVVSSLLASVTTPFMGSYNAAKWGQLGLIRTLQQEIRDVPGISVSAVAPGGVNTPIYSQAGSYIGLKGRPPIPIYSPERVARSVVARLDRPRRLIQSGFANPVVILGFRLFPAVYDALVGPLLRVFALADDDRTEPTPGNVFESRPEGNATTGRWRGIP
ncbi:SDR family NAD(P)-dependent oxidoreductase [Geodermatophilus sp. URMC 62]|uniref:SDR family NAD(P)-dependent oxidoreductase n=1 Tax=Geodermatophilus sp. URMC 62 TaxID=3423414 RepID=UPI00406C2EDF